MNNGYLRKASIRSNVLTPSGEQGARSRKIVAAAPPRLAKPENRDEIALECTWARSRVNCNLG